MDPRKLGFGFGRRVCPGAGFAETSVILNITNILACFNILKPIDVNTGAEYCPEIFYTTGEQAIHFRSNAALFRGLDPAFICMMSTFRRPAFMYGSSRLGLNQL
ncbi:hypothetical protein DFS33DRAFT_543495 [Desarmillaria ectypa]|nr:hypothetical protein DFS33DRAFT_543495 [Desarmillaria ectypa]